MTKKEKALKNDVLDILEDYENVACNLNANHSLSAKEGEFDSFIENIRKIKKAFRDVTLINEEL